MKKIILSAALLAAGFTCSYAASIEDITKDALINTVSHTLSGTFGKYDFAPTGDNGSFDWAFTTKAGATYQLLGDTPTDGNVFGWKIAAEITTPPPALYYMFQVDVDVDGMGKFDWVVLAKSGSGAYKLTGVSDKGTFDYSNKLDIDYRVNGTDITTGAVGTLDAAEETPPTDTCTNGCSSINFNNLAGYTVFIEDTKNIKIDNKETIYIFESATQVKIVTNRDDGGQVVHSNGTYRLSNITGFVTIEINAITGESSSSGWSILLDEDFNTVEDQLGLTLTKILPNAQNGVVIKENQTSDDGLTINSVDDIKGYTLTSNVAYPGTTGMTMQLTVAFNCDDSFDYEIDIGYSGIHSISNIHGTEINVDNSFDTTKISWYGLDEDDERTGDSIRTDVNNQLLEGACWSSTKDGGECSNDLYIESITGSGCS